MIDDNSWRSLPVRREAQAQLDALKEEYLKNGGIVLKIPPGQSLTHAQLKKLRDSKKIGPQKELIKRLLKKKNDEAP